MRPSYVHKWQLTGVWNEICGLAKDSQKYDIYINEERMYEIVFSSQQSKAKDFRRHCCIVLFPHVRQQLKKNEERPATSYWRKRRNNCIACLMICKIVTIGFKLFSMKTCHYKHKRMCIRLSYKGVKTPSPILKNDMFLMREIQAKTTLSS